jgi:N-acetylneuraminate synthase
MEIIDAILEANVPVCHVSLGMTDHRWRDELLTIFSGRRVVWYICTSCYPCENVDTCLKEISSIASIPYSFVDIDFSGYEYGFSGHHRGIAIDNAALTLGATWFERHFTLDRTMPGTDHAASLEYEGLSRLVRDLEATNSALRYRPNGGILDCEIPAIKKLREMA